MKSNFCTDTFRGLFQDIRENPVKWLSRLIFLLGPWAAFWMVETLNENDIFNDLYPWQVLMNLIWYYMWFFLCRLVIGRRRPAAAAAVTAAFVVGMVNHYILRFRGRILFPADLAAWRTAANVADGFDYSPDYYMQQAAVLLIAYLFLLWVCPGQKRRDRFLKPVGGGAVLCCLIYCFAFFNTEMLPALGIYTQQWSTQHNGFLLNFTIALRNSTVEKPRDYDREWILKLEEMFPATEGDSSAVRPTNIVVIMNEAFSDLTIFEGLNPDKDPTPFLHSMEENTIQGLMYAPVTGGGTASVEYEYLTGFSTLFQPPHTVAYQLYVEDDTPALSTLARAEGYQTAAFHPYESSGWNRPVVYENFEFEQQYYEEDVENPYKIRYYISDLSSYEKVFEITQAAQGNPCFVLNVTMQNHSGYAQGWRNLEKSIDLPTYLDVQDKDAEQYMALVRASDEALRELISHYSRVEEPTMVVFFGDHQPGLKNSFYEALYGKPLDQRTTEEVLQQYAVPFFIWTNYDIPEQQDVVISANYLGMLTAKTAGLPMTGYMNFLSQMYKALPVITPAGVITAEGRCLTREETTGAERNWLNCYSALNYCAISDLFDEVRDFYGVALQEEE